MGRLEEEVAVARSRAREERINLEARVEEVEESRVGEREKAVVRVKVLEERIARLEEREGVAQEEERVVVLVNTLAEVMLKFYQLYVETSFTGKLVLILEQFFAKAHRKSQENNFE